MTEHNTSALVREFEAFRNGYLAALRDINGPPTMLAAGIVYRNKEQAALNAFTEADDWVLSEIEEMGQYVQSIKPVREPSTRMMSTVYALGSTTRDLVKIGFTADSVEKRRRAIEKAAGDSLTVLATMTGSRVDEKRAHHDLRRWQAEGEWFRRVPEVEAWISQNMVVSA